MSQVDSIFVFAGCSNDDFMVYDNLYQFLVHEKTWYKIEKKDIWSSHCYSFGMVQFGFAVIGATMPQILYLDVWRFDIRSNTWTPLTDSSDTILSAFIVEDYEMSKGKYASRKNHACCYDATNNRIYIFVGLTANVVILNDLLYFDLRMIDTCFLYPMIFLTKMHLWLMMASLYDKNTDVRISLEVDQSIIHTAHKLVIASPI
jgi:hypothetical protein